MRFTTSSKTVFVPSRGFLFFYKEEELLSEQLKKTFSSPHGDFSFSMVSDHGYGLEVNGFRPLTGISLFLLWRGVRYGGKVRFSSPHGDFSFSITKLVSTLCFNLVFVPSRGFLFFYTISYSPYKSRAIFIICGANIFKPSECYF